jgi:hypothetical protein
LKKGQTDTIAAVAVLVVLVALVFLLVNVTSIFGKFLKNDSSFRGDFTGAGLDSRVLASVFLGEEIVVDGEKVSVEMALKRIADSGMTYQNENPVAIIIMQKFNDKYSCEGKNQFLAYRKENDIRNPIINYYPASLLNENLNGEIMLISERGVTFYVYAREVAKC